VADIDLACLHGWGDEIDGLAFGGPAVMSHAQRTRALRGVADALAQEAGGLG
jgi:hypothetical protein